MEKLLIDPQDLKNALDMLWFAAAEVESKAGSKDSVAMHFVNQDRDFVKRMMEKYPSLNRLP